MKGYPRVFFLALSLTIILATGSKGMARSNVQYSTYKNAGVNDYQIDYPTNFKAVASQTDKAMQQFTASDGKSTLKIWGTTGRIDLIKKAYLEEMGSITKAGGKIGYTLQRTSWYVITWKHGNQVNYKKVFCGKSADHCFWFSFPEEQRSYYSEIVEHIENSFKSGNLNRETMTVSKGTNGESFTLLIKNNGNTLSIKYANGKEELIVQAKNAPEMENMIDFIHNAQLSPDRTKIYFMSSAWATSDSIHVVEIATKNERYLCPGNTLKVIQNGVNAGKLIVNQHQNYAPPNYGSYDHYYLLDENGNKIKDLGEEMKGFE